MASIINAFAEVFNDLIDANKEAYSIGNDYISSRQQAIRDHARKSLEKSKRGGKKGKGKKTAKKRRRVKR